MKWPLLIAISFTLGACAKAEDSELAPETAKVVMDAFQAEDFDKVIELTPEIGSDSKWTRVRGTALQR
ncbi:MAG: hypothetical protein NWR99_13845, partial [Verrucomicrobiales bacterium]|nr:hypothetical protein [Verrucomicrobiales bacterium]